MKPEIFDDLRRAEKDVDRILDVRAGMMQDALMPQGRPADRESIILCREEQPKIL